jgi:hypothetical protein
MLRQIDDITPVSGGSSMGACLAASVIGLHAIKESPRSKPWLRKAIIPFSLAVGIVFHFSQTSPTVLGASRRMFGHNLCVRQLAISGLLASIFGSML